MHYYGIVVVNACILYTRQDKQEKEFIFRHSRTVFELLDEDGSNDISAEEFESFGFLFNFQGRAVRQIFREFDVSGDQVSQNLIKNNQVHCIALLFFLNPQNKLKTVIPQILNPVFLFIQFAEKYIIMGIRIAPISIVPFMNDFRFKLTKVVTVVI